MVDKVQWFEVVIYLDKNYSKNESIWVSEELNRGEITKLVNDKFEIWYSYDIIK